ncbi:MAG: mechanosensitive ion channel [Eubacteriales bacterium]
MIENFISYLESNMSTFILFGLQVVLAIVTFVIGSKLILWMRGVVRRSLEKAEADAGLIQFIDSSLNAIAYVFLVVIIAVKFGLEPASVAALFASVGVAIGLALQGCLSNIAGGIIILFTKPFVVGDYILEDTNKNEGVVKEIQIFHTKLQTVDNKIIIIPNGSLANNSLTNITNQEFRRLDFIIGISYEADLKKAKEILMRIIQSNEDVDHERDVFVIVDELAESSVNLGCKMWVRTEQYWAIRWAMFEEIKLSFDTEGIEIPYNKMEVRINKLES